MKEKVTSQDIKVTTKVCQDCLQEKDRQDFPTHGKYLRAYCKVCTGVKSRTQSLLRNYNTTQVEYDRLYTLQEGSCAICKEHQVTFKKRLAVDHNHATGQIRGLLCDKCNRGIGLLKDSVTILQAATDYLITRDCSGY